MIRSPRPWDTTCLSFPSILYSCNRVYLGTAFCTTDDVTKHGFIERDAGEQSQPDDYHFPFLRDAEDHDRLVKASHDGGSGDHAQDRAASATQRTAAQDG